MKRFGAIIAASLALTGLVQAQNALSVQVQSFLQGHVVEACDGRGGTFTDGVFERDLTGDGLVDLIVDHGGIKCNGDWSRSMFCGAQVCSVYLYVNQGGTLVQVDETLGIVQGISPTPVPLIAVYAHGGPVYNLRWNGSQFVNIGE